MISNERAGLRNKRPLQYGLSHILIAIAGCAVLFATLRHESFWEVIASIAQAIIWPGIPIAVCVAFVASCRRFGLIGSLALCGLVVLFVSVLLPLVQNAREAARRVPCRNNMRSISVAVRNYHELAFERAMQYPHDLRPTAPAAAAGRFDAQHIASGDIEVGRAGELFELTRFAPR